MENSRYEDAYEDKDTYELSSLSITLRNDVTIAQIISGFHDEALDNANYILMASK
jgi:hypothetical protein